MTHIYEKVIIKGICQDINNIWHKTNSISATVIYIYVALDTMAFLNMDEGQGKNQGTDFRNWVTNYLKTEDNQVYKYDSKDVWGARCAKLHSFSSFSDYAKKNNCNIFGYHDGREHMLHPTVERCKLISVPRLLVDFLSAVEAFLLNALQYPAIQKRIDSRITKVCEQFDINI